LFINFDIFSKLSLHRHGCTFDNACQKTITSDSRWHRTNNARTVSASISELMKLRPAVVEWKLQRWYSLSIFLSSSLIAVKG